MILSAGIVVVHNNPPHDMLYKYLLLRAYKNWDFPKGEVKPGEDSLQAAIREVGEETGITQLNFRWGPIFKETEPYLKGKKIARYYIAETNQTDIVFSINPELGKPEHDEYRWLNIFELMNIAPKRIKPIVDWADWQIGFKYVTFNVNSLKLPGESHE